MKLKRDSLFSVITTDYMVKGVYFLDKMELSLISKVTADTLCVGRDRQCRSDLFTNIVKFIIRLIYQFPKICIRSSIALSKPVGIEFHATTQPADRLTDGPTVDWTATIGCPFLNTEP